MYVKANKYRDKLRPKRKAIIYKINKK